MKQYSVILAAILVGCGGGGDVVSTTAQPQSVETIPTQVTVAAVVTPAPVAAAQETQSPRSTTAEATEPVSSVPAVVADTSTIPAVTAVQGVVVNAEGIMPQGREKHIQQISEKTRGK